MDTYAHGYSNTGHYARPGTHTSYCGRELQHTPNTGIAVRLCKACAKAEAADPTTEQRASARSCTTAVEVAETVEETGTEQVAEVDTYYALCINGTATSPLPKDYCEGMVETAVELDLVRTDMIEIIYVRAPGAARATTTWRVIASSRPEELTAEQAAEEAEAQQAAELVSKAEASDGTWRGEWIGEQGSSFPREAPVEPVRVRMSPEPAALARIKAQADADRATYRAEMDARQAAERARYGGQQAAAEPRVIEGVIVEHEGTTEGSTPADATHPNVRAAREALAGLKPAHLTDHHDVNEPTETERGVRGYMVVPREGNRVAVYWLEGGRIIRRDDAWHGPALDCLADRLHRSGWSVEKMLNSSQWVFAHRPQ
ncbi:hypothetical protein ACQEU8_33185 [Streptomyces sp. CA-250714]|uniref:hypothetical protein n=1 Tax=Streptomyces sp. CA-250714 TaxID=3240060 RepID=UPI003D948990